MTFLKYLVFGNKLSKVELRLVSNLSCLSTIVINLQGINIRQLSLLSIFFCEIIVYRNVKAHHENMQEK